MRYFDILAGAGGRLILRCAANGKIILRQQGDFETPGEFVNRCKRIVDGYNEREPNRPAELRRP